MSGEDFVITIDGPAGAGKSTVARELAKRLGFIYLESGALYRAIALAATKAHLADDDLPALARLIAEAKIEARFSPAGLKIFLDGQEVTAELRAEEVGLKASAISRLPEVRQRLNLLQRCLAQGQRVVVEGRDSGTIVFPEAQAKFFLTASLGERVRRRLAQLAEAGRLAEPEQVALEMARRDHQDQTRDLAPLKPAKDAVVIETTNLSLDEVVEGIIAWIKRVAGHLPTKRP